MKFKKITFKKFDIKKITLTKLLILSIICITLIIFIGTFSSFLFNQKFYDSIYQNSGAYQNFDKDRVNNKTNEIFLFFQNKTSLDNKFYTENEISHMQDVKSLIKKSLIIYYISIISLIIIYLSVYYFYKDEFILFILKSLFFSGILSLLLIALFFTMSFSSLFENFHKILFNGNYSFPYNSNLIKLFSEQFFTMFAKTIFLISGIKAIILSSIGVYGLNKKNYF